VSSDIVLSRILDLQDYLRDLQVHLGKTRDEQKKSKYEIERLVQLCIDTALSISKKVLVLKNQKIPKTCKEVFLELGSAGIISTDLSKKLGDSCGIRNILVHEYAELNEDQFYGGLKGGYLNFVAFIDQIKAKI
jgi:uncharacterized protein YutE (UPF0331/DUF86 family)